MKELTVVVLAVVAGCAGYLINVPVAPIVSIQPSMPRSGWIHLQSLVLPLFENVCEKSNNPMICRLSDEFVQSSFGDEYSNQEAVTKFKNLQRLLPKGEIFSEYNPEHIEELKIIYNLMCSAANFDVFLKIAAWARQNLNCGLYVNAIYMAIENRKDTQKLIIPPPYELLPNYFIRKDIIIQGSSILAGLDVPSEGVRDEGNTYTLDANYTTNLFGDDEESKLAYFREDIGLNSYYYLKMLKCPPWMNGNVDINSRYGEEAYHMMKQLVSRYNLERYSNGMPELESMDWDSLSDAPYDPMLVYSNGNEFIHRTLPVQLPENGDKALLQNIENNIATVASHMRETGYNKTQILNHLMEILFIGDKSYDSLSRHLLGKSISDGNPTIFEHYLTSLRDPMMWKVFTKMVDLIDRSLQILPPYSKNELYFPGVEVINIEVKKMMTNFENFEFDITEALKIGNGDTTFKVKIGQQRLIHKPYSLKLNISSLVTQKGLIKIYIGPKTMPGQFSRKKNSFALLDCFEINLKRGSNVVTRASTEMKQYSDDFMSLHTLRTRVEDAQFGLESLPSMTIDTQIGFPQRLTIPKGNSAGLPFQFFVFVAPFVKTTVSGAYTSNTAYNTAILSPLYPLDLVMDDRFLLSLPNALVKDFTITHKSNGGQKPNTNGYKPYDFNSQSRPLYQDEISSNNFVDHSEDTNTYQNGPYLRSNNYALGQKEPFDYKSKRVDYKALNKDTIKTTEISKDSVTETTSNNDDMNIRTTYVPVLKASFDYASQRKEPFDYKSKKVDYKSMDKDNRMITTDSSISEDSDIIFKDKTAEALKTKIPVLKSSYDYASKRKEPFDYKSKRVDYKSLRKDYKIKTTEAPINDETEVVWSNDNVLNQDKSTENVAVNVEETTKVNVFDIPVIFTTQSTTNIDDDIAVIPILKSSATKKVTNSIYNYIMNSLRDIEEKLKHL